MISWDIKKTGRRLISRAGQHCYAKNALLSLENVALSGQPSRNLISMTVSAPHRPGTDSAGQTTPRTELPRFSSFP